MKSFIAVSYAPDVGQQNYLISMEEDVLHETEHMTLEEVMARAIMNSHYNPQRRDVVRIQVRLGITILSAYEVSDEFVEKYGERYPQITFDGD